MIRVTLFFAGICFAMGLFAQFVGIQTVQPDRPLTIRGLGPNHELLSLRNHSDQTLWHINLKDQGVNFAQTGVREHVLFLHPLNRVGINTSLPQSALHVTGNGFGTHALSLQLPFLDDARSNMVSIAFLDAQHNPEQPNSRFSYLGMGRDTDGGFLAVGMPGSELGAPAERFRITGQGRVGIGTPVPQVPLHVYRTTGNNDVAWFETNQAVANLMVKSTDAQIILGTDNLGGVVKTNTGQAVRIATGDETRMYIDGANGNVALGTRFPQEKLHVIGRARFDGGIRFATEQGGGLLDYYRQAPFVTTLNNGNIIVSTGVAVRVLRVGNLVTVTLHDDVLNLTLTPATPELQLVSQVPAEMRPTGSDIRMPVQILNNGMATTGLMIIQTNGIIRFRPNAANLSALWTGNGNAGIYACSVSYVQ